MFLHNVLFLGTLWIALIHEIQCGAIRLILLNTYILFLIFLSSLLDVTAWNVMFFLLMGVLQGQPTVSQNITISGISQK